MMSQSEPGKTPAPSPSGILLIDKPSGKTSFSLVGRLRRLLNVKKIGHAGTLDPFATGVMVMLIGKSYTTLSEKLLTQEKEYLATVRLGVETDSYDCDGQIIATTDMIPDYEEVVAALKLFQGEVMQTPPMFSAKKKNGKKLYELARKGIVIEREPVPVKMSVELIRYEYPLLEINVVCSKGTYIRSIAHDLGKHLGVGGHLSALRRTRSGQFSIKECIDGSPLYEPTFDGNSLLSSLLKANN